MTDNNSSVSVPSTHGCSSTPTVVEFGVCLDDENEMQDEAMEENEQADTEDDSSRQGISEDSVHPFKRARKSEVWNDLEQPTLVGKVWKTKCKHCKTSFSVLKSGTTSHFKRHMLTCTKKKLALKQQNLINFLPSDSSMGAPSYGVVSALHNGKFDKVVFREGIAIWLAVEEVPFSMVEKSSFNAMLRRGIPQWTPVSRSTMKNDIEKVYAVEKKKLKELLKDVDRISLTTDLWRSTHQRIEYMVLTGHFVDHNWKLQKRVLSFVRIPPPKKGKDIANCIFKCLKEWDIENKVFTVSVDNASTNDSCIQIMKDTFSLTKRLICGGALFHVRCCAHILNIMVQHGLKQVKHIIKNVHDTVDYLNGSEQRLKKFSELVQQFNLKERRLVLECNTRWNSTYDMLACAIKFKEVFFRLAIEDKNYVYCPSAEDWHKIEKLVEVLRVFYDATNIISGSEYPTSNFFLSEVYYIKEMLDENANSSDDFVKGMIKNMTDRFAKYWGECNLLMAVGGVLDPRLKMRVIDITFPRMFPPNLVRENINKVRDTLYELYDEYKNMYPPLIEELGESGSGASNVNRSGNLPGMSRVLQVVRSEEVSETRKSELDVYLEEGPCIIDQRHKFDALEWWKDKSNKFRILSKMAADVLAVPITTVASESTFSAGSRVIDPYRSRLKPETVERLICTADWCKSTYGFKKMNAGGDDDEDKPKEIILPISLD